MNFKNTLISGTLVKRYKRFFADIKIGKKIVTAHCPNTGSMAGLLKKGNKVWITRATDPNRKLKFTLEIIQVDGFKIGVNTHSTNKIFFEALENNRLHFFKNVKKIEKEKKYGSNTRFDFLVTDGEKKTFIEVKNVTLSREKMLAEFPDSITTRGSKHLTELIKANKNGYKIFLAFVIQRNDCDKFSIAKDIDINYAKLLTKAIKNNLNVICYDCKFSSKGIKLNKEIKFCK